MASFDVNDISEKLAARAESVCRTYLPKGRKEGNYWRIGDATGVPGQSLHVRLRGPASGKGAAGRWVDEATGEFGGLLDIIRLSQGIGDFRSVLVAAARFLNLPDPTPAASDNPRRSNRPPPSARVFASRLFTSSRSLKGSLGEAYLNERGIELQPDFDALRFHPRCFHSAEDRRRPIYCPGLIAAVTDLDQELTGVTRTYLRRDGRGKAPVEPQRRSKGDLYGNGIRIGVAEDVQAVGEGLETTLSLRAALPTMPLVSATSANHLAVLLFPPGLKTLLVIRDNDSAGDIATDALFARGQAAGLEVHLIEPELDDLNSDLMKLGRPRLIHRVREQLPQALVERFMVAGA
ncbi:toprim domain-containing protein (plasmid) [Asticcacaulis sp. DW145]|uniref:DUF7146 domain-containing protein n=1 Tax=Asticcacaulis sp. DW145 TaxID=3095608 RepID=UPI00308C5E55|nr:toprim domain-containing protein [Asticcacaulis sp. DW145]